jgi:hypothetical protein
VTERRYAPGSTTIVVVNVLLPLPSTVCVPGVSGCSNATQP